MSSQTDSIAWCEQLIRKGEAVLATHRPNPPGTFGFPTLDHGVFAEWQAQALSFLTSLLGPDHPYADKFRTLVERGFMSSAQAGIGILKAVYEDLKCGVLNKPHTIAAVLLIEQICTRFHLVVRQLRSRHENRETLNVQDEYDVQDLLHALLLLYIEDVRPEEYTPSYGGKASRMDFLLKREATVIEAKKTRAGLDSKELATQLIEDIERYKTHPDCRALICFVYDPEGFIPNPRGIEADLSRTGDPFPVKVMIRPL